MSELTIYHNPNCSKSRHTLELLHYKGLKPIIVEYLQQRLTLEQLQVLKAYFSFKDFVRSNETIFTELKLSLDKDAEVLYAMSMHPILMQRPIVVYKNKAIIGRPPEQVLELFEELE